VFAGADIDCTAHSAVLGQEILGLLRKISCRTAGTVVEEPHRRRRSIVVGHRPPVGCCQYRNFRQCQSQQVHYPKQMDTLSRLVFVEEGYNHQSCVGYMYLTDAPRACDHNIELQSRAWRGDQEVHLHSLESINKQYRRTYHACSSSLHMFGPIWDATCLYFRIVLGFGVLEGWCQGAEFVTCLPMLKTN